MAGPSSGKHKCQGCVGSVWHRESLLGGFPNFFLPRQYVNRRGSKDEGGSSPAQSLGPSSFFLHSWSSISPLPPPDGQSANGRRQQQRQGARFRHRLHVHARARRRSAAGPAHVARLHHAGAEGRIGQIDRRPRGNLQHRARRQRRTAGNHQQPRRGRRAARRTCPRRRARACRCRPCSNRSAAAAADRSVDREHPALGHRHLAVGFQHHRGRNRFLVPLAEIAAGPPRRPTATGRCRGCCAARSRPRSPAPPGSGWCSGSPCRQSR